MSLSLSLPYALVLFSPFIYLFIMVFLGISYFFVFN